MSPTDASLNKPALASRAPIIMSDRLEDYIVSSFSALKLEIPEDDVRRWSISGEDPHH